MQSKFIRQRLDGKVIVLSCLSYYTLQDQKDNLVDLEEGYQFELEEAIRYNPIITMEEIEDSSKKVAELADSPDIDIALIGCDVPRFMIFHLAAELLLLGITPAFYHDDGLIELREEE